LDPQTNILKTYEKNKHGKRAENNSNQYEDSSQR